MRMAFQPPFVIMLTASLAWFAHSLLGPWQPILRVPILGVVLTILGLSFMTCARTYFTSRKTTLFVGKVSSNLVCEGPFRLSRNPMYVGVMASLLGIALWVDTLPVYLTIPVAYSILNFIHIPIEERMLLEQFGERYLAYSEKVRRWL